MKCIDELKLLRSQKLEDINIRVHFIDTGIGKTKTFKI